MGDPILCRNATDVVPGCLGTPDARYTMDFDDVEPGAKIYWCAKCGPEAHAMERAITAAAKERPGFLEELASAIKAEERKAMMGRQTTLNDPKRCETCCHWTPLIGPEDCPMVCGLDLKETAGNVEAAPPDWTCVAWSAKEAK